MQLTTTQTDRAAGVLLGQAVGDALGVPYEFGSTRFDAEAGPRMTGGGLGGYAPGQWSDDTEMAMAIALGLTTFRSLHADTLEAIAAGFLRWYAAGPADIGTQTRAVLAAATRAHQGGTPAHEALRQAAADLHERTGRTAGNGALMRTAVVALHRVQERATTAEAARMIAELTHADPLAGDSCVLWTEAVRRAVLDGELDLAGGLDLLPRERRDRWATWIEEAETRDPRTFTPNGYTVTALQAAWSAIHHTRGAHTGPDHVAAALHTAIAVGHDTDTVAAIAGGLLGARYGASGLPFTWTRRVHGWPGSRSHDLLTLGVLIARQGDRDDQDWPGAHHLDYRQAPLGVPHPMDDGVLLGTWADLHRTAELGVDAVVSLCRLGSLDHAPDRIRPQDHAHAWIVDSDDATRHQHLRWALDDAARAVKELRDEGRRVLLHCVAAQHRTPAVALRYARLLGASTDEAHDAITTTLGRDIDGLLWKEAHHD